MNEKRRKRIAKGRSMTSLPLHFDRATGGLPCGGDLVQPLDDFPPDALARVWFHPKSPLRWAPLPGFPRWEPPKDLEEARERIFLDLRDLHARAFLIGCTLKWVKQRLLRRGEFDRFLEEELGGAISRSTAYNMCRYAVERLRKGVFFPYSPRKGRAALQLREPKRLPGPAVVQREIPGVDWREFEPPDVLLPRVRSCPKCGHRYPSPTRLRD